MFFLFSYPPFQSIYSFIKTIKHCSIFLKYKRENNYVTFIVYDGTTVFGSFDIITLDIENKDNDFSSQLPLDIIFPKNSKSVLELSFDDSKISVVIRYETNEKTKIVQDFQRPSTLFNASSIQIPQMDNLICSFDMSLIEYKDLVDFSIDSHIIVELEKDLSFEIIGKGRKIIKTCQKHQNVSMKQFFSSASFSKIKGLGSLLFNKERIFNEIKFGIYQDKNIYYIILQSYIYPNILLYINPANISQNHND